MTARILDISVAEYHALPHFSASTAKAVIAQSPRHARLSVGKVPTKEMERGDIMHKLILGAGKEFEICPYDDWRTKKAQEARDKARAEGKVPVLQERFEACCLAAEAIRVGLLERGVILDGRSEVAVEWEDGGVTCKSMFDHVWLDDGAVLDLKIPESAHPESVERTAESLGYAIQAHAYTRALWALRPEHAGRSSFMFAFCEPDPPYAILLVQPDGMMRELGERRWCRARSLWKRCQDTGVWPAYEGFQTISVPSWALRREGFASDE